MTLRACTTLLSTDKNNGYKEGKSIYLFFHSIIRDGRHALLRAIRHIITSPDPFSRDPTTTCPGLNYLALLSVVDFLANQRFYLSDYAPVSCIGCLGGAGPASCYPPSLRLLAAAPPRTFTPRFSSFSLSVLSHKRTLGTVRVSRLSPYLLDPVSNFSREEIIGKGGWCLCIKSHIVNTFTQTNISPKYVFKKKKKRGRE